ncbi:MAG: hypothetical protein JNL36_06125 [Candidatus Kapabacteria bacterium]|nr:hypothetical protein [Candidatus Kapabacteria bacterium]
MKSLKLLFAVATMLIIGAVTSNAQVGGAFGFGFNVGEYSGIQGHYSVNNDFELGTQFGLSTGGSNTNFLLAPYAKFRFSGNSFKPYIMGQFSIISNAGSSNNFLDARFGGEYFANPAVAITGDVAFLTVGLGNNSTTLFGVLNPRVGVNWYFK